MPLATDIKSILTQSASLLGTLTTAIYGNLIVGCFAGVATQNDTILGVSGVQINGNEKTLRFSAEDVPGIIAGSPITWNGQNWRVKHVQLQAMGSIVKVFLVEAL